MSPGASFLMTINNTVKVHTEALEAVVCRLLHCGRVLWVKVDTHHSVKVRARGERLKIRMKNKYLTSQLKVHHASHDISDTAQYKKSSQLDIR